MFKIIFIGFFLFLTNVCMATSLHDLFQILPKTAMSAGTMTNTSASCNPSNQIGSVSVRFYSGWDGSICTGSILKIKTLSGTPISFAQGASVKLNSTAAKAIFDAASGGALAGDVHCILLLPYANTGQSGQQYINTSDVNSPSFEVELSGSQFNMLSASRNVRCVG